MKLLLAGTLLFCCCFFSTLKVHLFSVYPPPLWSHFLNRSDIRQDQTVRSAHLIRQAATSHPVPGTGADGRLGRVRRGGRGRERGRGGRGRGSSFGSWLKLGGAFTTLHLSSSLSLSSLALVMVPCTCLSFTYINLCLHICKNNYRLANSRRFPPAC